jgi:hypothetical protein
MATTVPTHLYHGTTARWLKNVLRVGLEPRGRRTARNNWKHVPHGSNPRCVYLTNSYAPYFAHNACRPNDAAAIVEIAVDRLDPDALYPDEDFLEQVSRGGLDGLPADRSMSWRTLHYRSRQFEFDRFTPTGNAELPSWWLASLSELGTCAHRGTIPVSAITRVVTYPFARNHHLQFVWDPTISLLNQRICGDRYRELTRRLFSGEFTRALPSGDPAAGCATAAEVLARLVALPPIDGWSIQEVRP